MIRRDVSALMVLCAYMTMDTLLTIIGLGRGLTEVNQFVVLFVRHAGVVLGPILHRAAIDIVVVVLVLLSRKAERMAGCDNNGVTYLTVVLITLFYLYVLINNVMVLFGG